MLTANLLPIVLPGDEPSIFCQNSLPRDVIHLNTSSNRVFEQYKIVSRRPLSFLGFSNNLRICRQKKTIYFIDVFLRPRPQAKVMKSNPFLLKDVFVVFQLTFFYPYRSAASNEVYIFLPIKDLFHSKKGHQILIKLLTFLPSTHVDYYMSHPIELNHICYPYVKKVKLDYCKPH